MMLLNTELIYTKANDGIREQPELTGSVENTVLQSVLTELVTMMQL